MPNLTKNGLAEIKIICDTWLLRKADDSNFNRLNLLYNYYKKADFTSIIKSFTDRLLTINWNFTKSEEVSGSICFFGGVMTSILNYGYIQEIEGLFTFAVCYMLIDHFLDNEKIIEEEKSKFIQAIYSFILSGKKNENPMVQVIGDRYLDLIQKVPRCREFFIKLFISELKGYKVQKTEKLSREEYLKAAEEKGGLTSLCIASIIGLDTTMGNERTNYNYTIGSLIQKVDDALDMKDDMESDIYTLARYDMDNGTLDCYIYETIIQINYLSPVYNIFKIILLLGLILTVHDNPGCISDSLNNIIQNYDIFNGMTKEKIIEWFHDKIYNYMKENDL